MIPVTREREPLAYRMAPRTLAEFVGQRHILAPGKMLRRMIEADQLSSILLFGAPGTGKTSLARVIAATTRSSYRRINAVTAGVADIRKVITESENSLLNPSGRIVLFIDEIHRFNKAQQDALLPNVEDGSIILVGATTENPFFEVNKALISRSTVFQLFPLEEAEIVEIVERALGDEERGFGALPVSLSAEALAFVANLSNGDARIALNGLELAVLSSRPETDGTIRIGLETMKDCLQKRRPIFDKNGESHYDSISAFIKSMRGSDPDASLHYLARMLVAGEDAEFIARRMVVLAAEDVGMANPQLLSIAMSAYHAVQSIGMPEARIILAEVAILLATSAKSNASYLGIEKAIDDVNNRRCGEIPFQLRNAPVSGMKDLGYGEGYQYAHKFPEHYVDMDYLPEALRDTIYYEPGTLGYESKIRELTLERRKKKNRGL